MTSSACTEEPVGRALRFFSSKSMICHTLCADFVFAEAAAEISADWLTVEAVTDFFAAGAFAHGAVGRRIDPSWGGPIELFLVPASAPRLV